MCQRPIEEIEADLREQAARSKAPFYLVSGHEVVEYLEAKYPNEVWTARERVMDLDIRKHEIDERYKTLKVECDTLWAQLSILNETACEDSTPVPKALIDQINALEEQMRQCAVETTKVDEMIVEINRSTFPFVYEGRLFDDLHAERMLVYDNTVNYV